MLGLDNMPILNDSPTLSCSLLRELYLLGRERYEKGKGEHNWRYLRSHFQFDIHKYRNEREFERDRYQEQENKNSNMIRIIMCLRA